MNSVLSFLGRYRYWLMGAGFVLVSLAVFAVLVIPPLIDPPPEVGPGYDVFGGELTASTTVEPGKDQLIQLDQGLVAAFIPKDTFGGAGRLILKERRADLVPVRESRSRARELAVDMLFLTPDGEVLSNINLVQPILLCFQLTPEQADQQAADPTSYEVQHYAEYIQPPEWLTLPGQPGWQEGQLCAEVEHLSLFALARKVALEEVSQSKTIASPTPRLTVVAPELYEPDGLTAEDN